MNKMRDVINVTATTTGEQNQGVKGQDVLVNHQLMLEMNKSQLGTLDVLRATTGNTEKRLMIRQEMRATTRAGKSAEAAIKQIATQKLYIEKEKMREGIQVIMQEVTDELHTIRQANKEAIEAQRYKF